MIETAPKPQCVTANGLATQGPTSPHVSVIVPVFNDQNGLNETLFGLADQDRAVPFEVIVVDNGSAPPMHISEDLPFLLRRVDCPKPGSYAARNMGIAHAKAPIMAFLDAGCVPAPSWLRAGIDAIESAGAKFLVGGDVLFFLPQNPTFVSRYQCVMGFRQKENIEIRGMSATANLWLTAALAQSVGGFREDLLSGGDREWCLRARSLGIVTRFSPNLIVHTPPRATLRGAIRQARRVVGGQYQLAKAPDEMPADLQASYRKQSLAERLRFLWKQEGNLTDKLGLVSVAGIIWAATQVEKLRLRLGRTPERR